MPNLLTLPDRARWAALSPLLDELLALEPSAREGRLLALQPRDETLAHELRALLQAASRAEAAHFLAGAAPIDYSAAPLLVGKQVGAYVVDAHLGQGGNGSVWRAHRADGRFEGAVAIKLLHLSLLGRAGAQRFQREGAILARLTHPNIARLLDAGVTQEGQPYLVLELVEGQRIDHHCDALRLNVEQRLRLFGDVLAAVAHAHNHLVIHRDIKPNNILVSYSGEVKLLDFGIAKLLQDEADVHAHANANADITLDGQRAMTPEHAAPEQLQGGPVTTATDVYALGVLLYQLLAGRHPTALGGATPAEAMRATLDTEAPPLASVLAGTATSTAKSAATCTMPNSAPGARMPQQLATERGTALPRLRRQLQGDLANIVARALRKRPAERYANAAALGDDLRRHLAHEPVSARPDSLAYRTAKFLRRRRRTVLASMLVLLATAAGVAGTVSQARRAEDQAMQAQQERDNATRQLGYAKSTNELLNLLLQEGADKPFTTAELLARAEPVVEQQFAGDPAQRAYLLGELAAMHLNSTNVRKAEPLLLRASAAARGQQDVSLHVAIECLLAYTQGARDAFDRAQQTFRGAFATMDATMDAAANATMNATTGAANIAKRGAAQSVDRSVRAECLKERGDVADMKGDTAAALADARAALAALAPLEGRGAPRADERMLVVTLRNTLAILLGNSGQAAAGAAEFRRAIAELAAMGRAHTPLASTLQHNLGALLYRAGQTTAALTALVQAMDIQRTLGSSMPSLEGRYAVALIDAGQPHEAKPLIERAVAAAQAQGDQRAAANLQIQGAQAWCDTQTLTRCTSMLSAGQGYVMATLPAGHPTFAVLELAQAQVALVRAELPQARTHLLRAVALSDLSYSSPVSPRCTVHALVLLARTEQQLGDLGAAQAHATRAVALARTAMAGFSHSETLGSALMAQGAVQQARGDSAAAQASWRAALVELQAAAGSAAPAAAQAQRLLGGLMNVKYERQK